MSTPAEEYGFPWDADGNYGYGPVVRSVKHGGTSSESIARVYSNATDKESGVKRAERIAKSVNLLQNVPDDAPCFHQYKSDEVQLALAVLAGDFGAAAALADEVVAKYQRPVPPPSSKAVVGVPDGRLFEQVRAWNRRYLVLVGYTEEQADQILRDAELPDYHAEM